ncbi:PAS domain S-box protein [Pleomorphochaeta sp. DL1XJH-081]|uniref:PAS domain S-box protein n=1 Tax=Pleomorphochaeta sp. DL1XJH-081 TaxID=3409690 RepID=UPI003BB7BBA9
MANKSRIITSIRIGFLVIALCVIGIGVISFTNTNQVNAIQRQIAHTEQIIEHTNEVSVNLHAFIGAERGYLISPHPMHAEKIKKTSEAFSEHMAILFEITKDNAMHQQRLKHVERTFDVIYHDLVEPLIAHAGMAPKDAAPYDLSEQFQTASSISHFYLAEMTRLLDAIDADELAKRDAMVASTMENLYLGRTVNILGTLAIIIVILLMLKMAVKRIRRGEELERKASKELHESHERLENVIEATRVGTWEWEVQTGRVQVNERWVQLIGYTMGELDHLDMATWESYIYPEDLLRSRQLMQEVYDKNIVYYDHEYRMLHKDGHWVWIHCRGRVTQWDEQGNALVMSGTHDDISQLKDIQHNLFLETKRLETTLLSVGDGIITTDAIGCIVMINSVAEQLTGWTKKDAIGKTFAEIFVTKDANTGKKGDNPVSRVLKTRVKVELMDDTILVSKDGSERYVEDSAAPIQDDEGSLAGVILVFRDVTEKRMEQQRILALGLTDQLTQVQNRRSYITSLQEFDNNNDYPVAFMIADVNGLKLTNDAFGHDLGDQLLVTVATVLTEASSPDDVVVRLGGDEFVVLMPHTDEQSANNRMQVIKHKMEEKKVGPLPVSVSFGYAVKEHHGQESAMILRQAESRMYRSKITESPKVKRELIDFLLSWQHGQYPQEESHSKHVEQLSARFAKYLGLPEDSVDTIMKTARYHDIGKVAVDRKLLQKQDELDDYEWHDIKRHAEMGYNLLRTVPELYEIAEGVLHHHERWDGSGYPRGISGEEIPLISRIISICDTYDAIVGDRSYGGQRTHDEAITEILACSATQFDATLVSAFVKMMCA